MNFGKLTERLTVRRPAVTTTDTGAQTTILSNVCSCWCAVRYGRGFRQVVNNEIFYAKSIYFTMHDGVDVKNTDIIEYRSEKYRILAIEYRREEHCVEVTSELVDE